MSENERLIKLSEHEASRFWKAEYADLTEPEQVFLCVWELESEVNNGGFSQYYFNSSGDLASQCPSALRAIGAMNVAAIVEKANAAFRGGVPGDQDLRQSELDAIGDDAFEVLDAEFLAYPDNLTRLLYAYVSRNRGDIRGAIEVGI